MKILVDAKRDFPGCHQQCKLGGYEALIVTDNLPPVLLTET
jgi:hypothetical protein